MKIQPLTFALVISTAIVFVATGVIWFVLENRESAKTGPEGIDMIARGEVIYGQNCASCHGMNLEGQANWRSVNADGTLPAPPHDSSGHTWHHSDTVLFNITKWGTAAVVGGDFKSNMPGFAGTLEDEEIWAVLRYIKSRWPEDIQVAQSERSG